MDPTPQTMAAAPALGIVPTVVTVPTQVNADPLPAPMVVNSKKDTQPPPPPLLSEVQTTGAATPVPPQAAAIPVPQAASSSTTPTISIVPSLQTSALSTTTAMNHQEEKKNRWSELQQFLQSILEQKTDYSLENLKNESDWNRFLTTSEIGIWILVSSKDYASLEFLYEMSKLIPRHNEINDLQVRYAICLDQTIPPLRQWNTQFSDLSLLPSALVFLDGKRQYAASRGALPSDKVGETAAIVNLDPKQVQNQIKQALNLLTQKRLQQLAKSSPAPSVSIKEPEAKVLPPEPVPAPPKVTFNFQENKTHVFSESSTHQPNNNTRGSAESSTHQPSNIRGSAESSTHQPSNIRGSVSSGRRSSTQTQKQARYAKAEHGHCARSLEDLWIQHEKMKEDKQKQNQSKTQNKTKPKKKEGRLRIGGAGGRGGGANNDAPCLIM